MDQPRDPSRPWAPSPFGRLARAHALSVGGDAVFTTAMAGLVFFSVTRLDQARWQVAAALLFTVVPFSLAAPFIGPLIDRARGGRKWMIVALCGLRALGCLALAGTRDNQLLLYPQFTLVLVFAQGYILARAALVPATVRGDEELVRANAKLAAISGIAAGSGAAVALFVMWTLSLFDFSVGPSVALAMAAIVYTGAAVEAVQLPSVRVAAAPPDEAETVELSGPGIQSAAVALSVVRVVVGFTTFLLAFHFKDLEAVDPWGSRIGLVGCVVLAQAGFLLGSAVAARVRRAIVEEQIIVAALTIIGVSGLLTALMGELAGAVLLAFAVGLASNSAKQSFDAIVQRDAPDANRGRAFARFETRFQLWWVAGALVPVAVAIRPAHGALAVGLLAGAGAVWFALVRGRARRPAAVAEPAAVAAAASRSRAWPSPGSRWRRRPAPAPVLDAAIVPVEAQPTVEDAVPGPLAPEDPTIEMPALTDPLVAAQPAPWRGADRLGSALTDPADRPGDEDRTAVWPAPPGPPPAPWPGPDDPGGLPVTEPAWPGGALGAPPDRPRPSSHATRPVPLADDEVGAPSDAAWFSRPGPPGGDDGTT